ncbi:MAG: hypothetical protein JRD94_16545, partial [Deltaproteobacteria bacterium]|nr:hypothetical protein [Deltaproteobacteria bacterium]
MRRLVCAFAAVLAAFTAASAYAQSHEVRHSSRALRWLVVPTLDEASEAADGDVVVPTLDEASEAADGDVGIEALHTFAEALRQEVVGRGQFVWRADRAAERFEVVGSAPAPRISQSDIDLWVEHSRAAVRYLARADYKAARRE